MSPLRITAFVVAGSLLAACQTFPRYQAPLHGTAIVDVSRANVTTICTGGKGYSVAGAAGGKLAVPVDAGPVTLYSFIYLQDYNVSYSCYPGLSFQPQAGSEYLFNIELDGQRCMPDLYRKDPANTRIGLQLEPSVERPGACAMPGK